MSVRQLDLFGTATPVAVEEVMLTSEDEDTLSLFAWQGINMWYEVVRNIVLGNADSCVSQAKALAKATGTSKKLWLKGGQSAARLEAVRKWRSSW